MIKIQISSSNVFLYQSARLPLQLVSSICTLQVWIMDVHCVLPQYLNSSVRCIADSDRRLLMRIPLRSADASLQHFEIAVIPISCIFMPHVDRDCSYFWSSRLYSYLHFGMYYLLVHSLGEGERGGGERERERNEACFLRSCIDLRPPAARSRNRSTANKSRRFLRRAARVRSCPVFRSEASCPSRGEHVGSTNNVAVSLKLFLAVVWFLPRRWMIPRRFSGLSRPSAITKLRPAG